jgi:hypothetical protein
VTTMSETRAHPLPRCHPCPAPAITAGGPAARLTSIPRGPNSHPTQPPHTSETYCQPRITKSAEGRALGFLRFPRFEEQDAGGK